MDNFIIFWLGGITVYCLITDIMLLKYIHQSNVDMAKHVADMAKINSIGANLQCQFLGNEIVRLERKIERMSEFHGTH